MESRALCTHPQHQALFHSRLIFNPCYLLPSPSVPLTAFSPTPPPTYKQQDPISSVASWKAARRKRECASDHLCSLNMKQKCQTWWRQQAVQTGQTSLALLVTQRTDLACPRWLCQEGYFPRDKVPAAWNHSIKHVWLNAEKVCSQWQISQKYLR